MDKVDASSEEGLIYSGWISFRLAQRDKELLEKLAEMRNEPMSRFIRTAIKSYLETMGIYNFDQKYVLKLRRGHTSLNIRANTLVPRTLTIPVSGQIDTSKIAENGKI